jgi:hypothetical protein
VHIIICSARRCAPLYSGTGFDFAEQDFVCRELVR